MQAVSLVGEPATSRGNIDYISLALPTLYDPLGDYGLAADGGAYSGEVGRVPEPASLGALLLGSFFLSSWWRRRSFER